MKASELRIGNYLKGESLDIPRLGLHHDGDINITWYGIYLLEQGLIAYTPIPLTPEWLERAGFVKTPYPKLPDYSDFRKDTMVISPIHKGASYEIEYSPRDIEKRTYINVVKHVHELQNLYHALTGEELEFKGLNQ